MNICYLANSRFPSERAHMTQIVSMCNAFASCGHTITLLVTDRKTSITEDPETYYGVPISFSIEHVSVIDIANGIERFPRFLRPLLFFIQRISYTLKVRAYLKKNKVSLIYARDEWILYMLSLFTRVPMVWESHEARYTIAARLLVPTLKKMVVISEGIFEAYKKHRISEEKMIVAHDAVDDRFFKELMKRDDSRELLGLPRDARIAMYIGGLESWKGSRTLFEASNLLKNVVVVCVGGKPAEIEIQRKQYPRVMFLGSRPYKMLPDIQQAGDVLIIPNTNTESLGALYTSPLKLFAHLTSNVPIIASAVLSIQNVVTEDEVFFVPPDDPQKLCASIEHVLSHEEEARELRSRAYEKSKHYTWQKRAENILKEIEE